MITPQLATYGAVAIVLIGGVIHQRITRFNVGYDSAIEAMQEGTLEHDGKVFKILTEADEAALEAYKAMTGAEDAYIASQDATIATLSNIIARHNANNQGRRNDPPPPSDFGSMPLPSHYSLRLDGISRERESSGSANPDDTTYYRPKLTGYPTADTPTD